MSLPSNDAYRMAADEVWKSNTVEGTLNLRTGDFEVTFTITRYQAMQQQMKLDKVRGSWYDEIKDV